MIINNGTNFQAYSDITDYCYAKADTTNSTKSVHYLVECSDRTDLAVGVAVADAEGDENEPVQLQTFVPGTVYTVLAGETIAAGEKVCPGTSGYAYDADTTNDRCHGTCLVGGDAGDRILVIVDSSFGDVVA
jgi:hypothetical protein